MGAKPSSTPYTGRGSTIEGACADLEEQLQKHINTKAYVKISRPLEEHPLSPRARSPRYAGPFVAMAVLNNGKDCNVVLEKDKNKGEYYAKVAIVYQHLYLCPSFGVSQM
jgi:predicted RNase H-like HicB family nuclease